MCLFESIIQKSNVADNAKSIRKNGKLVSIAEISESNRRYRYSWWDSRSIMMERSARLEDSLSFLQHSSISL